MSSTSDFSSARIIPLNNSNYQKWSREARAFFLTHRLWSIVNGTKVPPPTTDIDSHETYLDNVGKAAGELYLMIDDDQRVHIDSIANDPHAMWLKLEAVHLHKHATTHFNAMNTLLNIRKQDDESLQSVMNRVDQAVQSIKALHPSTYDIAVMDNELAAMALIRALPDEYDTFATSLLLQPSLTKEDIQIAFKNEENRRIHHSQTTDSAFKTSIQPSRIHPSQPAASSSSPSPKCDFCHHDNHNADYCEANLKAKIARLG
jgi:hypothetical protein